MYSLTFDQMSKKILVHALEGERKKLEASILEGKYPDGTLILHEQILQLMRAVLYAKEKGVETTPKKDQSDPVCHVPV